MRLKSTVLSFLGNTAKVTTVTFLTLNYLGGFVVVSKINCIHMVGPFTSFVKNLK